MPIRDRFWAWVANHIPRRLVYWAAVRLMVNATVDPHSNQVVPELTAIDALARWKD